MKKNYKIKQKNKIKLKNYIASKIKKANETNARQSECSTRK